MLQKGVYPHEYMDEKKKFNKTLPKKDKIYIHLNMGKITDADYKHAERVCKNFEIKS